jgi:hypothetical protein
MNVNKPPDIAKLTKQLLRLNLARLHFDQAKALAEKLIAQPIDPLDSTLSPQIASIVVTYARSFGENNGIGALPELFTNFTDNEMRETHGLLINLRNKLYAHRDALVSESFTLHSSVLVEPYKLQIRFEEDGGFAFNSHAPEMYPANLPSIARLCGMQNERANAEIKKLLPVITKGKKYPVGTIYTVGVDFP